MSELLPLLLIVLVVSAINAGKKKKKAAPAQPAAPRGEWPGETPAAPAAAPMPRQVAAAPMQPRVEPRQVAWEFESAEDEGFHEGEDPCHDYMLADSPAPEQPMAEPEADPQARQDLVRGFVMAEILRRPARRGYGR